MTGLDLGVEEPWELPEGWAWTTVGSVVSLRGEKVSPTDEPTLPFVGMDDIENDGLTIRGSRPFSTMKSAGNRFYQNDVLYGRLRPYLNKTAVVSNDGAASGELLVFQARLGALDVRYLQYFLHSKLFVNASMSTTSGDRPRADFADLAKFGLPLPPLAEQRRIVARIDALFAEIAEGEAALARARAALETFRRALLKAAVTGELTREWREARYTEATGSDVVARLRSLFPDEGVTRRGWRPSDELNDLPSDWEWCAVSEAGEVQLGRQRAPQHHAGDHMRPYLRVANVLDDELDLSDVKSMNFTPEEFRTFALRFGDILLNEGQAPDLLGRPAMYRDEIPGCCFQKTLLRFRAKPGILPDYALLVFRHYMHCGRFKRESRITTNIGHLTQVRFVAMEFPVPPTDEQAAIMNRFKEMNVDFDDVSDAFQDAARLRQAVLKAAFEGRLVPRDPTDEPARALLERLAANPAATAPRRRGRPKRTER